MEIGSEFHSNSVLGGMNEYSELSDYPKRYVLSGRTGLHLVAEELKTYVKHISLPDYCCGSMIAPFVTQGFQVSFYQSFDLPNVSIDEAVDAVLVMDYFGFVSAETFLFARRCKKEGKTIIVDATQTAFSHSQTYQLADYIVVSYRKWFDSLSGVVYSKDGFSTPEYLMEHHLYVNSWRDAARLKEKYVIYAEGEKQKFLTLYSNANRCLENDYQGMRANDTEIEVMMRANSMQLRYKRKENARILIDGVKRLSNYYDIKLLFSEMREEDCPLFVPILLDEQERTFIRSELIKNRIYCPCHWPKDTRYPYQETIYHNMELSLICDQRYGVVEMKKQLAALNHALSMTK